MEILNYINTHLTTWQEDLTSAPYHLKIRNSEDYYLLKYDILTSDFSNPIVQEARGSIFRFDEANGKFICVCRAFDKFFNFGEPYAAAVDWETSSVQEKVDGSLIKFWRDRGVWYVSTNGTINAAEAPLQDSSKSYAVLASEAIGDVYDYEIFLNCLDENYTYMFELVSPENKLVVPYKETKLYYLGQRDTKTEQEYYDDEFVPFCSKICSLDIREPRRYHFSSFSEMVEFSKTLTADEEGYVVCDRNFNRVKVKGTGYLDAFKFRGNGITRKKILTAIMNGTIDDLVGYFPEFSEKVNSIKTEVSLLCCDMEHGWRAVENGNYETRKDKALAIKESNDRTQSYCFYKLSHPDAMPREYVSKLSIDKLNKLLEGEQL